MPLLEVPLAAVPVPQRPQRRLHPGRLRQVPGLEFGAQPVHVGEDLAAQLPSLRPFGWIGGEQAVELVLLPLGLLDGHASQVLNQAVGVAIAWVLAIVGTLVILKICDLLLGVRVRKEQEIQGLDVSLHGEEGYIFES